MSGYWGVGLFMILLPSVNLCMRRRRERLTQPKSSCIECIWQRCVAPAINLIARTFCQIAVI